MLCVLLLGEEKFRINILPKCEILKVCWFSCVSVCVDKNIKVKLENSKSSVKKLEFVRVSVFVVVVVDLPYMCSRKIGKVFN